MAGRNVQGGEVVVVGLDLGPFGDPVTETYEKVHDFVYNLHRRMQAPLRVRHAGERDVDRLGPQALLALGGGNLFEPTFESGFNLLGGPVSSPAHLATRL